MKLDECYKKIDRYLAGEDYTPRFVNIQNPGDLNLFVSHFTVGKNTIINASEYAKDDAVPYFAAMLHDLKNRDGNIFVLGVSTFLKLLGEKVLQSELGVLISSSFNAHVVFVCFQFKEWLSFSDIRARRLVYDVDGEAFATSHLVFISNEMRLLSDENSIEGIHRIADSFERMDNKSFVVITNKNKSDFPSSLIPIRNEKNAFNALCSIDKMTTILSESYGDDTSWKYALSEVKKWGCWEKWIFSTFGPPATLHVFLNKWGNFTQEQKWLYFISLKLFETDIGEYLSIASRKTTSPYNLIRNIYRTLLDYNPADSNFWTLYNERKTLLSSIGDLASESVDFVQYVKKQEPEALYYLTDLTQREREEIIILLSSHYDSYGKEKIIDLLEHIYYDLWAYLKPYFGINKYADEYFQEYKYQKIVNHLFPSFLEQVEEQGKRRQFFRDFAPRAEIVSSLDTHESQLFFVDALGVEYLSFILHCCKKKNLMARVHVGLCNLPSITSHNKDFLDSFDSENIISVKSLDEIKHHGTDSFDYTKTKYPIYLAKELEIISELIEKIWVKLKSASFKRIYIISDHGASRLAVVNEHENQWTMKNKGEHSGRCCPKSDADIPSDYAIDENGFWILANYDRFKGGRAANVEVHGGASLEEVLIPIIEIKTRSDSIEIELVTKLPIEVSYRKKASLRIFSKTTLDSVTVSVSGVANTKIKDKQYTAIPVDNNCFVVDMPEIRSAGDYIASVYSNGNYIDDLKFSIKKEGASENNIL